MPTTVTFATSLRRQHKINGKPVHDATKNLRIFISPADARRGKTKSPGTCAAALAICRTNGAKAARVHIGRTYVEHPTHWLRYITPTGLRAELASFDRGTPARFMEGGYTLYAPKGGNRLGSRTNKKAGPDTTRHAPRRRRHIARTLHRLTGVRQFGANV